MPMRRFAIASIRTQSVYLVVNLLLLVTLTILTSVEVVHVHATDAECTDLHPTCQYWAEIGECNINPAYMYTTCELSKKN